MSLTIAATQPYFMPYIGYWQLIAHVDTFVLLDDVQFIQRGWIHRNRYLNNNTDTLFTLPLAAAPRDTPICQRKLADTFPEAREKLLKSLTHAYRKAPFYNAAMPLVTQCMTEDTEDLTTFIHNSLTQVGAYLGITTPIIRSSQLNKDPSLVREHRLQAICHALQATTYVNPVGGTELYDKDDFKSHGINLRFLKTAYPPYPQFTEPFIPHLSIIDVLMFNDPATIRANLNQFTLL